MIYLPYDSLLYNEYKSDFILKSKFLRLESNLFNNAIVLNCHILDEKLLRIDADNRLYIREIDYLSSCKNNLLNGETSFDKVLYALDSKHVLVKLIG